MDENEAAAEEEKKERESPEPREAAPRDPSSFFPLSSRDLAEWLLLAVLSCICILPGLLPGRTLGRLSVSSDELARAGWMDTPLLHESRRRDAAQHVPWTQFAASRLARGDVPLWDPYAQLGAPLLGNGRTAFFYPTILLHMALPAKLAWALDAIAHLLAAGLGAWWLARRLLTPSPHHPITPSPPLLAAVAYMLAAAHIASIDPLQANVAVLLPWALLVTERLIERTTAPRILVAALIFALQFLGGHAPASSALLLSCIVLVLLRIAWPSERAPSPLAALQALPAVLVAAAVGFLLTGVQWLPLIYNATGTYTNAANRLVMSAPPTHASAWWAGLIPLLLLGVFLFIAPDRRRTPLVVLLVICAILSQLPVVERLLHRSPYRVVRLIFTTATGPTAALMLAILAAAGLRDLHERLKDHAQPVSLLRSLLPAASLAAVAALAALLNFIFRREMAPLPAILGPMLAAAALMLIVWHLSRRPEHPLSRSAWPWVGLTAIELLVFAVPRNLGGPAPAGNVLPTQAPAAFGVAAPRGSDPITTERARRFLQQPARIAMPRFWTVPIAREVKSGPDDALAALAAPGLDPRRIVITDPLVAPEFAALSEKEKDIRNLDGLVRQPGGGGLRLRSTPQLTVLEHTPDLLRLSVTNPAGWLVVADAYAPGWIATLSAPDQRQNRQSAAKEVIVQKAALVAPAFGAFRAVPLESVGNSPTITVTLRYLPKGYQHGLLMSAGGVILLIILAVWPFFREHTIEPVAVVDAQPSPDLLQPDGRPDPTGTSP